MALAFLGLSGAKLRATVRDTLDSGGWFLGVGLVSAASIALTYSVCVSRGETSAWACVGYAAIVLDVGAKAGDLFSKRSRRRDIILGALGSVITVMGAVALWGGITHYTKPGPNPPGGFGFQADYTILGLDIALFADAVVSTMRKGWRLLLQPLIRKIGTGRVDVDVELDHLESGRRVS